MKFNRRQFNARLERIQKSQAAAGPPPAPGPFDLDPTIVETLGHDVHRLEYLSFRKHRPEADLGDLTSPEIEELALLQRSVPERLQLIAPSMEGYGVTEYRRDTGLFVFGGYRPKQISAHQIAQARIRIAFFELSAEGSAEPVSVTCNADIFRNILMPRRKQSLQVLRQHIQRYRGTRVLTSGRSTRHIDP